MSYLENEQTVVDIETEAGLYANELEGIESLEYDDISDDLMDYVEPMYSEGQAIDYGFN